MSGEDRLQTEPAFGGNFRRLLDEAWHRAGGDGESLKGGTS